MATEIQCGWCHKHLGWGDPHGRGISHGICASCLAKVRRPLMLRKRAAMKATARGINPKRKWDVGERVKFRRDGTMILPAHRHLNANGPLARALWSGVKGGYYTYRAGRYESKAKTYREKARSAFANPRVIPGTALEVRYRRATDGKLYYHPFEGPVKMVANADGSVTLRGSRRIWADDRERGFWERYGHSRTRRRNPMARRRRKQDNTMLWLIGGAAAFFFWPQISQALGTGGAVSTGGQSIIPQPGSSVWYSDPYQGGGGEYFTGTLPPGASPPWRLASTTEIGSMTAGLLSGYLADAGGGLVAPAPGFTT